MAAGRSAREAESLIREAVGAGVGAIEAVVELLAPAGVILGVVLLALGLGLLFASLRLVTTNMRRVLAGRAQHVMNRVLDRGGGLAGMLVGAVLTVLVMTSSITT